MTQLRNSLRGSKFEDNRAIHTGPLIRREDQYKAQSIDERRKQLFQLSAFVRKSPITYQMFVFDKRNFLDEHELAGRMARELSTFVQSHLEFFQSFDRVIVYYDNGQAEITRLLSITCGALFFDVDFRRAIPADYFLLQAADYFCTLELLKIKHERKALTKSDKAFFYKPKELQKMIKGMRKKRF